MKNYLLFIDGKFSAKGSKSYIAELIRDYVETHALYGNDSAVFTVVEGVFS